MKYSKSKGSSRRAMSVPNAKMKKLIKSERWLTRTELGVTLICYSGSVLMNDGKTQDSMMLLCNIAFLNGISFPGRPCCFALVCLCEHVLSSGSQIYYAEELQICMAGIARRQNVS